MKCGKSIVFFSFIIISLLAIKVYSQPTDGLLAYWPFNRNAIDESGNGNNGNVSGATLTEDRFGHTDSAYAFNGVDNYIGYPVLWNSPPDSLALVAWFNIDTSQYAGKILYHGDKGEVQLFVGNDSAWAGVHLGQSVNDPWYYVRGACPQNDWQMMTVIWIQGESFKLYLNSIMLDSISVPADELLDPGSGYQPSIGSYGRTLGGYFVGKIDDIRIYGRALTIEEINSLFNEGTTDVEEIGSAVPNKFELSQNFPNPFNPTTTINFSIPEETFVSLKIFNSIGEEVETLVAKELSAGDYKYDWNAINLPSGIYFYKIQASNFGETKKMMLLK